MSDPESLLKRIIAQPEDNGLRRSFARALRASDPAWAAYIDESIEMEEAGWSARKPAPALQARLESSLVVLGASGCVMQRGFPETVYCTVPSFVANGSAILDAAPILKVAVFSETDDWNALLPDLLSCRAISRVRSLDIRGGYTFDFTSLRMLAEASTLRSLVRLDVPDSFPYSIPEQTRDAQEGAMWPKLFESPTFRRMVNWGLGNTRRKVGDRVHVASPESDFWEVTTYEPMPPEDRELERRYGYIPALHATNWKASVLDVLRGKKPDFPPGAPPTEAMYTVPPPEKRSLGPEWS